MSHLSGLTQKLKRAGHKLTPARRAIITVLENNPGAHLSHNQILAKGQVIYPRLSRATVYRTMELLVEMGTMRSLYLNDPTQRFVSAAGGHHHLICTTCGAIFEFDHCTVDRLAEELAARFEFRIMNHLLEFQGFCQECQ